MRILITIFFSTILSLAAFSQEPVNNSELALIYFQNKEYEKASVFYKELYENSNSKVYFDYYLKCLIELNQIDEAEKFIKKQTKKREEQNIYLIELGCFYKLIQKQDKAINQFEQIIKKMGSDQNEISRIANAFISKQEFEWAEKTYLQAKKQLKEFFTFSFDLANVYFYQKKYSLMIDEYMELLTESEGYIQSVQNRLQSQIYDSNDNSITEILKSNLIRRVQKNPEKSIFSELLIWLLIQENEFESAFEQAKALDKRFKEQGDRIIALGGIASTNGAWDVAASCYKYVIEKGPGTDYYISAKTEYLNAQYSKITKSAHTSKDLIDLEAAYKATLTELGENNSTFPLVKNLAHIQAFYLDKSTEAISLLEKNANSPLRPQQMSECKTELADILLMSGDPWQASLYYAQVEKANKDNPVGHEAKFKKSRLAFYMGEFKWAEAQLDVLKASTSKLIANDAMDMSLLISENTGHDMDTSDIGLKMFANADLLMYKNKDSLALLTLDSIPQIFKGHPLEDDILYKKYEISLKQKKFNKAGEFLNEIITKYPDEVLTDKALFKLAELHEIYMNDANRAKELYKELITKFKGSIYIADARRKFRKLRGDNIE